MNTCQSTVFWNSWHDFAILLAFWKVTSFLILIMFFTFMALFLSLWTFLSHLFQEILILCYLLNMWFCPWIFPSFILILSSSKITTGIHYVLMTLESKMYLSTTSLYLKLPSPHWTKFYKSQVISFLFTPLTAV